MQKGSGSPSSRERGEIEIGIKIGIEAPLQILDSNRTTNGGATPPLRTTTDLKLPSICLPSDSTFATLGTEGSIPALPSAAIEGWPGTQRIAKMKLKVQENSTDGLRLVLGTSGWLYLLIGWGFVLVGVLSLRTLGDRVELRVSGKEVVFTREFLGLFPREGFRAPASDVTTISLVLRKGFGASYEVAIESAGRPLYHLALPASDGDAKREIAAAAMEALERGDAAGEAFVYGESAVLLALALGGVCIAAGLACGYFIQTVTVSADRSRGRLTIRRRRHFSFSGTRVDLDLSEVTGAETRMVSTNYGRQQTGSYQVHIHLEEDAPVPLAIGPMFTKQSGKETAKVIRDWLRAKARGRA